MFATRDNWIVLGILLVVLAIFTLAIYLPQQRRIARMREQLDSAQYQLEQDLARAEGVVDMARRIEQVRRLDGAGDQRLTQPDELADVLKEISTHVQAERLETQAVQPGSLVSGRHYSRLPIIMRCGGSFQGLAGLLGRLDAMGRMARVDRISVKPDPVGPEGRLQIELQVNVYFTEG